MQRSKLSFFVLIILAITTISPIAAIAQSGRGRPRVQPPTAPTIPPQPVTVPAATTVIKQEQAGTTSRFVLKNGITVIISEQYAAPIAASVAYFKADLTNESPPLDGIARLLERMIVRKAANRSADRTVVDARAIGALIGSDTTPEGAAYWIIVGPEKMKDALAVQADMLQNPQLDDEAMRRESSLLLEEEKAIDNPADYSMARLLDVAFAGERNADSMRPITREQIIAYYRAHYRPENLIIAVAGAVSTFNALVQIQQLYGKFGAEGTEHPAANSAASKPTSASSHVVQSTKPTATHQPDKAQAQPAKPTAPTQTSAQQSAKPEATIAEKSPADKQESGQPRLRYIAERGDINQSIVTVGFQTAGAQAKERAAIEVLAAMLGEGRASRLNRSIIDAQMAAGRIQSSYVAAGEKGLLAIQMWIASGSIDKAESWLFKELDNIRSELPNEAEMARAKSLLEKRFVDLNGEYLSRAFGLARAEASAGSYRAWLDYRNQIRAITAEDVQRAAAKYFTLANTIVHEYLPASGEPRTFNAESYAATVQAWAGGFAAAFSGKPRAAEADPSIALAAQGTDVSPEQRAIIESVQPLPVKDFSTLNGPRAFVREDHSQPKITVALLFQGGRVIEDEATSGVTELMLRSVLYGTPRRTGAQMAHELDQLGAEVEIVTEPDFFGFALSVLSRNADRALKLLRDAIEEPAFRDDDIARARIAQAAAIRDARDSMTARSHELLFQAMFAGFAYSLPPHGREEAVMKATSQQLHDLHERAIKRQLPLAIIVGDTNGSALVSSQLAEGFRRRELDRSLQVKVPPKAAPAEKGEQRRRELTVATIGFAGPKSDSNDLPAIELIEALMNDRGGRLLAELREKQAVALDVALTNEALFTAGAIYAQIATTPQNEQRARAALLAEMERLAASAPGAEELASARAVASTSNVARLQSQTARALKYAQAIVYQRQAADVDALDERLSKVTTEDIKRVASAYFKSSAAFAGVVRGSAQTPPTSPKQN
ncbi:MAG TPA: insulinase family protein [Blastocatellia bacterium]|nr:insulinase family protein [Blastocatellia bacterium]